MFMDGLIVAAGRSERMGGLYKMALDLGKYTVIENTVAGMAAVCSRVIVVSGFNADKLQEILQGYKEVEIVFNPNYNEGMYSSIKTGLKQISSSRFFCLPGDYPLIDEGVYQAMLEVEADIVIPTYQGQAGHPVLFKHKFIEKILTQECYTNLRQFIANHDPTYVEVDCPGILMDIDNLEDYRLAQAMMRSKLGKGQ
ncbi:ctp:molybdopterin cytidylyltransferase [hydrocarbon metagenome]|uniref:Ctp:molybdopterin cytidylyltransferase n=1 Tax=hydrocarbon metagenome TaxID=938273 RepID=A0A0W8E1H2_9ZZZZ